MSANTKSLPFSKLSTAVLLMIILSSFLYAIPARAEVFNDPLKGRSIPDMIVRVIDFMLGIAALVALMALVIGSVRLILGGFDNEQEAARAKKIIFWAVIGLVVVILSYSIIRIVGFTILQVN